MLNKIDSIDRIIQDESSTINYEEILEILGTLSKQYDDFDEVLERPQSKFLEVKDFSNHLSHVSSILQGTVDAVKRKVNTQVYVESILDQAKIEKKRADERIQSNEFLKNPILPGKKNQNKKWFEKNRYKNYGRLLIPDEERMLGLGQVDYNDIHKNKDYLFTNTKESSDFSRYAIQFRNGRKNDFKIIGDKTILTLGSGSGADEELFLSENTKIVSIEGSKYMRKKLKDKFEKEGIVTENIDDIFQGNEKKFYLEELTKGDENKVNYFNAMEKLIQEERKFDTFYFHSAVHYFDTPTLEKLLKLAKKLIKPGGYIAGAFKGMGATLDGEGILICGRSVEIYEGGSNESRVIERGWFNPDGQMRYFRDSDLIHKILDKVGFTKKSITEKIIEDYEVPGKSQKFNYFIYKNSKQEEGN